MLMIRFRVAEKRFLTVATELPCQRILLFSKLGFNDPPIVKYFVIICVCLIAFSSPILAQVIDSTGTIHLSRLRESVNEKAKIQLSADASKIQVWSDSLKTKIAGKFSIDSLNYQSKIDSVRNLAQPVERCQAKL